MSAEYIRSEQGTNTRNGGREGTDIGQGAGYQELKKFTMNVMSLSDDAKKKLRRELGLIV
ncbi:hypothetical protein ELZ19_17760 [Brucella abortus]|nr:hypothetical protein IB60_16485 [Brucella abortus LMN1]RUQ67050.1 hypothetical protein ELZ23_15890 [Brucella abortus]RUQ78109.1 hypothetical protein ELZ22_17450 [Brucella abortus]RUQ88153.1 hypothetical protein ELZ18_15965 [Brucella abortus]RUQ89414.1 hypothetical protein ELZ20_17105 [Brucella abortus]